MNSHDITIIGGGIIGLLSAYELALKGAKVCVLEMGEFAKQSSWAAGGIYFPLFPWRLPSAVNNLVIMSMKRYPGLCQYLVQSTGIDPEWTMSGMLLLQPADQQAALEYARYYQLQAVVLNPAHSRYIVPGLVLQCGQQLWFPKMGHVRSSRLLRALVLLLKQMSNVTLMSNTKVDSIAFDNQWVKGVYVNQQLYGTGHVVIAAGAWSAALLPDIGLRHYIQPLRGQMIAIQAPPGLCHPIIMGEQHYIIPRRDGLTLVGSTLEKTGFCNQITTGARLQLHQFACQVLPTIEEYPVVHQWAGLRPAAPRPVICELPYKKGLYLASGHDRFGIATAPGTAQLICDLVLRQSSYCDMQAYQLPVLEEDAYSF